LSGCGGEKRRAVPLREGIGEDMRGTSCVVAAVCLFLCLGGGEGQRIENNGGHYRYGNIRWRQVQGNTVEITLTMSYRRDFQSAYWKGSGLDGLAVTGDTIQLNGKQWPVLSFGDETLTVGEYLKMQVTAYSVAENWVYGTSVVRHTYATPTNNGEGWLVRFQGCCKLSEVANLNERDAPWEISSTVNLLGDSASPIIAVLPVVSLPDTGAISFFAPAFSPLRDGGVTVQLGNPNTALTSTVTTFTTVLDEATGKVTIEFPGGVAPSESAQEGNFFFMTLNATGLGGHVQADFLIRIIRGAYQYRIPKIGHGTISSLNLPGATRPIINATLYPEAPPPPPPRRCRTRGDATRGLLVSLSCSLSQLRFPTLPRLWA